MGKKIRKINKFIFEYKTPPFMAEMKRILREKKIPRPLGRGRFIYWTPRILSIIFICFLALFSLDVIAPEATFWQIIIGLFMHNIPVFVLSALLWISWKREIVGGVVFILAGLLYAVMILSKAFAHEFAWYMLGWILTIAGPAFLIGTLFLLNWRKKKEQ